MRPALTLLCLALFTTLAFSDSLNPVNPDFHYPEQTVVDSQTVGIPYKAKFNTGYLTVNNQTQSKIFYVAYPAGGANNADATFDNSAPLILWLQGGPGCSDGTGNYQEVGPFTVDEVNGKLTPTLQSISWNGKYNLLFVDNPVGVGFSVSGGERPDNAMDAVRYLQVFLIRFFQLYSNLAKNDLYIFGESFGGHYIPALATVLVQNHTNNNINLKGIGIGDGWTDPYVQIGSFTEFPFAVSLLDEKSRDQLFVYEHAAREALKAGNKSQFTGLFDQITNYLGSINDNVSPYNFEYYGDYDSPYADWLNTDAVKKAYGVDPSVTFKDCVDQTYTDFYPDIATSYAGNYTYLLSQNIIPDLKVILYSGQNDIICNTVGTYNYIANLEWNGVPGFINSKKQILKVSNGTVAGNYKNYKQFTFAVIYGAGHMVPMDQPESSQLMLDMFIQGKFSAEAEKRTVEIDM